MRRRLLLSVVSVAIASFLPFSTCMADSFKAEIQEGVMAWFTVLDSQTKTCQVGLGTNGFYSGAKTVEDGTSGAIVIPAEVNGYTVTTIGWGAFRNFTGISSVSLPNTLTTIQPSAFYNTGISTIDIPASVTDLKNGAFQYCKSLEDVTFHDGIINIGGYAFAECPKLNSIVIPETVQTIETGAFNSCTGLASLTIENAPVSIESSSFYNCTNLSTVSLGNAVTYIGESAFYSCPITSLDIPATVETIDGGAFYRHALTSLTLHEGLKNIKDNAFYAKPTGCSISTLPLPSTLVTIGAYAFYNWNNLTELTIPAFVETIGRGAFSGCTALKTVQIGDDVESIGELAFQDCTALETVTFNNKIQSVGSGAFSSCTNITKVEIADLRNWCSIDFDPTNDRSHSTNGSLNLNSNPLVFAHKIYLNGEVLDEITIPNGVTKIGLLAFAGCNFFDKVTIPTSVTTIGENAFLNCKDLETIVFKSASSVSTIEGGAFRGCTGLTTVTLPESVETWGSSLFQDCTNLTSVNIPSNLIEIPASTFNGCTNLSSISLPEGIRGVGNWSFYNCTSLTRIDIPVSLENIGTEAFKGCTGLTGVYIKDMAKWCAIKLGNYQYQGSNWAPDDKESNPLIFAKNLYLNGELVTDLVIPEGVEAIMPYIFWGANKITSVTIPNTVTSIGNNAFWYCTNLRSVTIPNSVTSIGKRAFGFLYDSKTNNRNDLKVYIDDLSSWLNNGYGIGFYETGANNRKYTFVLLYVNGERVNDIIIPSSITNLGDYALAGVKMNSLTLHKGVDRMHVNSLYYSLAKYLYLQPKFAPDIWLFNSYYNTITTNSTGFAMAQGLTAIYVPSGKSTTYKNKWTNYAAIIKEADLTVSGEQTATTISEMKGAYTAVTGNFVTYMDLSGSTLDENLTAETLKAGDTNSNIIYYLPSGSNIEGDNIVVDGVAANVVLTDGNPIYIPMEFTANNVNNTRSIAQSETNAYTLCLPYNYTLPTGLKAYMMNSKDSYDNLVFVETESIVANEPYLIVANSNIDNLNASNVVMKVTPDDMENKGITDFEFRGTLQKIPNKEAADMGAYILQANREWHPVSTDKPSVYIAAGRAYIIPSTGAFSPSMIGSSLVVGSVTGIKTISKDGTEQYYDLQGRRIDKPTKGLYIKNGKKTIIK